MQQKQQQQQQRQQSPVSQRRKSSCEKPKYKDFLDTTASINSSECILESFELEADDILGSFESEIQSLFSIEFHHNQQGNHGGTIDSALISELSMNSARRGHHVATAARTKKADNNNNLVVAIHPETIKGKGQEKGTIKKKCDDIFQQHQGDSTNHSSATDADDEADNNSNNYL